MARASKKSTHHGTQGKRAGAGAMAEIPEGMAMGENAVLSNRDKHEVAHGRGQDSKHIQTEQLQDHSANRGE
jgi:hypothetical protein